MGRAQILAIGVDKVTMDEALERCLGFLDGDSPRIVVTPNAEIAYNATNNPGLAAVLNSADLVIPDGVGVVWASRYLGDPVPEKVAGVDLSTRLVEALAQRGKGRIYILGGEPGVADEAARRLQERFPGAQIAGTHHGYFKPAEQPGVIADIKGARPDVLFVALGSPRQEFWLAEHLGETGARLGLGVGGTVDVWAGRAARSPDWMTKAGLEWLFRIVKLGRVSRSLPPLAKFVLKVIAGRMRGR